MGVKMLAYVKLFPDLLETVSAMDDAMAGRLIKAIMQYANGIMPKLSGPEQFVFLMLKSQMDRDAESYEKIRLANSLNGAKGGRPRKPTAFSKNPSVFEETEKSEKSQEEEKDKEKDKEYTTTSGGNACEEITGDLTTGKPDPLIIYISENLTGINAVTLDEILAYREQFPDDMIKEAVTETLRNGGHSVKYALAILNRWFKEGLKTVGDVRAANDKRTAEKARAAPCKPGKPMITRSISEDEFTDTYTDIMRRPKRATE